ncbi:Lrp/AsnC family transcriptional regulator [Halomarina pelagica]|uniref:Lrp/AsnC family transcriptional regulator n=1 Tax=Halomarina pelagica TaxID=2961599 RepID=UPI0020C47CDE|nr:winged helix-turn-helix transcriptional regulator [Halomarina sp. BND7]
MSPYDLDEVDKQILTYIQEDARFTATGLAERVGVSDNTIHHRLDDLEEAGVITGYRTTLDPDEIGLSLYFLFVCTVPISRRAEVAAQVRDFPEVVEVTELMTGQRNLLVKVVGAEDEDITHLATRLDELDLEIDDENMIRAEYSRPLEVVELG